MKIYNGLTEYHPHDSGAAVALGFFDGVHLGHRAVIGGCVRDSGALTAVALTFRESPAATLGKAPPLLSDNARKAELIAALGAQEVIFADFAAIRDMSPADFVQRILCEKLNAKQVTCGFNYRFGKDGAGDTETLEKLCTERGIRVRVQAPVFAQGEQVSSSRIRRLLAQGEIARANALLGYRYAVIGSIGSGNRIGAVMGFPTVNLSIGEGLAVPRLGVYASWLTIGGRRYRGATNIGVHPTVGANDRPLCETFLLGFDGGDLYGKQAVCEPVAFIRPERRFDTAEALTEQIKRDCESVGTILAEESSVEKE